MAKDSEKMVKILIINRILEPATKEKEAVRIGYAIGKVYEVTAEEADKLIKAKCAEKVSEKEG